MGTDDWGTNMAKFLVRLRGDEKGATAVEYALIIALIMLAMVASLNGLSSKTSSMWNNVSTTVLSH
jgi:pilus assembly protein Flp/PilA